jgi:hypothetical protein
MAIDRILGQLDSLIDMGEKVVRTKQSPGRGVVAPDRVDIALFQQWRTSSLAFLNSIFNKDSIHYQEYAERCKITQYYDAVHGLAILKAAKYDIESGYLQKLESLVSANVFSDFLEMAEYLLSNGYKDPSASLIGAVLEDGLRRICNNNGIPIKSREDISSLNSKLAAKSIYNPLQQKQIQVWNDVRNNSDHGKFDQYKIDDVQEMLTGVRKFLTNYLV